MAKIKGLRRTIIVICLLILILSGFTSLPESKYYNKNLKVLVNAKEAQVIEAGKGMKIDEDTIFIKRIINTQDNTYIRYAFIRFEQGWSFSEGALKIFDDKGKEYHSMSGSSSGKLWGQDDENRMFIFYWFEDSQKQKIKYLKGLNKYGKIIYEEKAY